MLITSLANQAYLAKHSNRCYNSDLFLSSQFLNSLSKNTSQFRLLPKRESLWITLPLYLVCIDPLKIILPKHLGKNHAKFEVCETNTHEWWVTCSLIPETDVRWVETSHKLTFCPSTPWGRMKMVGCYPACRPFGLRSLCLSSARGWNVRARESCRDLVG